MGERVERKPDEEELRRVAVHELGQRYCQRIGQARVSSCCDCVVPGKGYGLREAVPEV